ncbi:flagellar biosynthesis protein FliA [Peptococcaceae bacterium 1198_IL3148]
MSTALGAITAFFVLNGIFLLVSCVASSALPQPLSKQEELKYFYLFKQGNEEAFSILMERNLAIVDSVIKKFAAYNFDEDDLITVGTIGLIKAIQTYDINELPFNIYASDCIEKELKKKL